MNSIGKNLDLYFYVGFSWTIALISVFIIIGSNIREERVYYDNWWELSVGRVKMEGGEVWLEKCRVLGLMLTGQMATFFHFRRREQSCCWMDHRFRCCQQLLRSLKTNLGSHTSRWLAEAVTRPAIAFAFSLTIAMVYKYAYELVFRMPHLYTTRPGEGPETSFVNCLLSLVMVLVSLLVSFQAFRLVITLGFIVLWGCCPTARRYSAPVVSMQDKEWLENLPFEDWMYVYYFRSYVDHDLFKIIISSIAQGENNTKNILQC